MTDRAMARRVRAVEKRLGVTGRPLEQLSDLDLLGAIEMVSLAHEAAEAAEAAGAEAGRQTGGGGRAQSRPMTSSSIRSVSLRVLVFCWLTW